MSNKLYEIYGESVNSPTRLVMSGVESDAYWDIAIKSGVDRVLVSYHYIQQKGKNFLRKRLEKHPHIKVMIDSGAYTFHIKEEEYKNKPIEFWENYLERYTNFVRENKDLVFSCVELDIGNIIGFDKLDELRAKYFEPLKDEGILVCYVWHEYDGIKYWETMCQKYDYVGFSLQTSSSLTDAQIMKMVNTARRYNSIIHGFALTRVEIMSKLPFFTGDSTTWLVGTQYGELNWFDGRKLKRLKKDKWKTVYKQKYIKLGANWDLAGQENPYELIRINLLVFREAEKYIIKRIKARCYWLKGIDSGKGESTRTMAKKILKRPSAKKEVTEAEETKPKKKLKVKPKKKLGIKKKVTEEPKQEAPKPKSTAPAKKGIWEQLDEQVQNRPQTKFEEFMALSDEPDNTVKTLEEVHTNLPPLDWYDGEAENYKVVAKYFGIPLDLPKEEVLDILYNYRIFLVDTDQLEEYTDEQLCDMANFLLKIDCNEREEAISSLTTYFEENARGERSDYVSDDSDAMDEAPPRPKERDSYLEEQHFNLVDVSEAEMANLLPAPVEGEMPEVEALDAELAQKGIVAVRDEKGRFLKGQKKVRKPKSLGSKFFPKLACNTCYKAGECPEYKPDFACAFEKEFKKFKTRDINDLQDAMMGMADANMERLQRLLLFETMDGGMADPTVSAMIDQNMRLMDSVRRLHEQQNQIAAMQRRVIHADGTEETTTTVTNPQGGILSRLFAQETQSKNPLDEEEEKKDRKDVTNDVVSEQ